MDNSMTVTVADMVISKLTTLYGAETTFNADKIAVIVENVVLEVISLRRYKQESYSDEMIEKDLFNYQRQIFNIAEYDFAHIGAPHETSHSENSTSRTWIERNKLFAGIIPLSHF